MATASPTQSVTVSATNPLVLWHLLSLDAPTVAALWTWFIAVSTHTPLPASTPVAMAIAVWILYAADRLLDARLLDARLLDARTPREPLEARHHFHHAHRARFLFYLMLAGTLLAALLPHLARAALHLYLILGFVLAIYFLLIHTIPRRTPKEIAVGVLFAAAVFIPTIARQPSLRAELLPRALLFAAVCSLNCLFIYSWEHPTPRSRNAAHPVARLALGSLPFLAVIVLATACALAILDHNRSIPIACALSTALLLAVDRNRHSFAPLTLRAAADLVLTTPILLLPFVIR